MQIATQINGPWATVGFFSCVLHMEERIGSTITMGETIDFRTCVGMCGLKNLRFSGSFFTWNNKQGGDSRVYKLIEC